MTVQVLTDSGTEHPLAATEAPPNSLGEEWTVPSSFVHRNCEPEWEPGNEDVSGSMTQYPNSEGEDDDDVIAARMAQDEHRLEPHHPPMSPNCTVEQDAGHSSDSDHTPRVNDSLPNRREAELNLERCPIITGENSQSNLYTPFASQLEWEVARWAKLRGPTSTSFTKLMAIDGIQEKLGLTFKNTRELNQLIDTHLPGRPPFQRKEILVGQEVCKVYFRDVIQCIRALFGDLDFTQDLIFRPEKHYVNEERTERMYHDMHTGSWWWLTQAAVEKDKPGATIIPVLISTDKTQLTQFRNKSAYLIYMTIGNIPKHVRRKTSSRAYVLLGYLPTTKLEEQTNKAKRKRLTANLYHACLCHILQPLVMAGKEGVLMSTAAGEVYRTHPVIASFIGDYPEQVLTTCTLTGDCPWCGTTNNNLGNFNPDYVHAPRDLDASLAVLNSFKVEPAGFLRASSVICMKPVPHPFWRHLHLKTWILSICDPAEIDAWCCRLPPNHQIHLFMKGISSLSRVTGQEHDQICQFLLGIIINIRLPDNLSNGCLLRSTRALLDFLYIAQYPVHTDTTLELLTEALSRFHANKGVFSNLGLRDHFNILKFHFMSHYVELIKALGTTDNFNTQYTERLHIDLAKDAYAATNHKDEYEQMMTWLDRQEQILRHNQYINWRKSGAHNTTCVDREPPSVDICWELSMAKHPSLAAVSLDTLQDLYGAPLFKVALRIFVSLANNPTQSRQQLEHSLWQIRLSFTQLPVWHVIKFASTDPITHVRSVTDSIHVRPAKHDKRNWLIPGRFNTMLINDGTGAMHGIKGHSIGRIHVVFTIPVRYHEHLFDCSLTDPDGSHGMIKLHLQIDSEGNWLVHLLPSFGPVVPAEWTSSNVLDCCEMFYLSTFSDRQIFRNATLN
ncbi:hypothetical protein EI94DRAFT_1842165 [Lactarius quietus]|nr:hypothetical protein EI94DRAFT_1842165 [Lactarius quietus]